MPKHYWLCKSEPMKYSFADLMRDKKTRWDGVRNHLAAKHLKAMQLGDECFFYHSNEGLAIVGLMKVIKTAYPDPSDATGKFVCVDVAPVKAAKNPLTLAEIKTHPVLGQMVFVKQSRLSVSPVNLAEARLVLALIDRSALSS